MNVWIESTQPRLARGDVIGRPSPAMGVSVTVVRDRHSYLLIFSSIPWMSVDFVVYETQQQQKYQEPQKRTAWHFFKSLRANFNSVNVS